MNVMYGVHQCIHLTNPRTVIFLSSVTFSLNSPRSSVITVFARNLGKMPPSFANTKSWLSLDRTRQASNGPVISLSGYTKPTRP